MKKKRFGSQIRYLSLMTLIVGLLVACRDGDSPSKVAEPAQSLTVKAAPVMDTTTDLDAGTPMIYTTEDLYTLLIPTLELNQVRGQASRGDGGRGNGNGGQRGSDNNQRGTETGRDGRNSLTNLNSEQIRLRDNAIQLLDPQSNEPVVTLHLSLVDGQLQGQVEARQRGEGRSPENSPLDSLGANFVEALMNDLQAKGQNGSITALSIANGNLEISFLSQQ